MKNLAFFPIIWIASFQTIHRPMYRSVNMISERWVTWHSKSVLLMESIGVKVGFPRFLHDYESLFRGKKNLIERSLYSP